MKSKIIAILMILLLILSCVSFATEDVSTTGAEGTATEIEDNEETKFDIIYDDFGDDLGDRPKFKPEGDIKDDLFKIDDNIVVTQNIDGNVYLMGDTVTIKGVSIEGNVFVCGKSIYIEGTEIRGSVYAAGENIVLKDESDIYYDVYIIGQNVTIEKDSWIERNAKIGGQNVRIDGLIDGNAYVDTESLQISEDAEIGGTLEYESETQAKIPARASIGSVKFNKIEKNANEEITNNFLNMSKFMGLLGFLVKVSVVYALVQFIKKNSNTSSENNSILKSFGLGCLFLILVPIISITLMITVIGLGLGFIILLPYIFALYIANSVAIVSLSKYIFSDKINTKLGMFGATVGLAAAVWLVGQIAIIGGIVWIFTFFFGLGEMVSYFCKKYKKNKTPEVIQGEKIEDTENKE